MKNSLLLAIILLLNVLEVSAIQVQKKSGIDAQLDIAQEYRFTQMKLTNQKEKKYKQFDLKNQEIPWDGMEKNDTFTLLLNNSQLHQDANKSSINWAGVPDDMIEAMKRENKMPKRGINNQIIGAGPWQPHSFDHYSQKFMPNGTNYMFFQGDNKIEESVKFLSQEMEKLGVKGAYEAFKMLRPKAYRVDLWRWMALWYYGGIYMDAKMGFSQDTSKWINFKDDEFVMCAAPNMYTNNGFFAMTQYHPYGLLMTQHIINNVANRYYVHANVDEGSNLNVTGPEAVRSEFIDDHQLTWSNLRCYWDLDEKNHKWHVYTADNQNHKDKAELIMISDPENLKTYMQMKSCPTCNDYTKLYRAHAVYCDEPGDNEPESCDGKEWTSFLESNSWNHELITSNRQSVSLDKVRGALASKNISKPISILQK